MRKTRNLNKKNTLCDVFALFSTYAAHKINDINWHSHYNFLFLTQNIAAELTSF